MCTFSACSNHCCFCSDRSTDLVITLGALYGATLFICFNNASTVQTMVSIERSVHYREKAAGMYSSIPYALSQVLIEIPYVVVQGTLYALITYSMLGFQWTAAKFFWYFYITIISLLQFTYYGMMMVAITPNVILASIVSAFFSTLFNLYAGFLIPRPVSSRNPITLLLALLESPLFVNLGLRVFTP